MRPTLGLILLTVDTHPPTPNTHNHTHPPTPVGSRHDHTVEDLNIIITTSTDAQQVEHAKTILPLRTRGNMLLCTLLIGNTLVNVMLSVLTGVTRQSETRCDKSRVRKGVTKVE